MKKSAHIKLLALLITSIIEVFAFFHLKQSHNRRRSLQMTSKLIVGLNKYSHDTSCAIINADNGELLFTQAKERITGRKHDGGAVGDLMRYALKTIDADINDIALVVSNNHHYRVLPFEKRIPFYVSLNYVPPDYNDPYNLLPNTKHLELSHHLAHAYSAIFTSPYDSGLILVMDGMGESYKSMIEALLDSELDSTTINYMHDLKLIREQKNDKFVGQPTSLRPGSGYREAETAYYYDKNGLVPVFKRWSRERSPPELYNSGFEYHESLGAVYSRISSYVLGDWNACGKIMGLAPWADKQRSDAKSWFFSKNGNVNNIELGDNFHHRDVYMSGNPYDGSFNIDWAKLENLPDPNQWSEGRFGKLANVAASVQDNLEGCAMQLVSSLRQSIDTENLILTGGVALNSVMNAKIANCFDKDSSGFANVYVPPAPGDEGIALGCAYYGYQTYIKEQENEASSKSQSQIFDMFVDNPDINLDDMQSSYSTGLFDSLSSLSSTSTSKSSKMPIFSPYQGKAYSNEEIQDALLEYSPWIAFERFDDDDDLITTAASDIESGGVIAWYQGRSELGQRALGARSILADPRVESNRQRINRYVKEREWYRPLAPSVLAEHADDWFVGVSSSSSLVSSSILSSSSSIISVSNDKGVIESPYMSITAMIRPEKQATIPAVCHIDGSARLQTISSSSPSSSSSLSAGDLYYRLISAFYKLTNIPMVLNTSFNRKGEPIVETPDQAIRSFLACNQHQQHLSTLYLGNWQVKKRAYPIPDASTTEQMADLFSQLIVAANPIYLSEVTTSSSNPNQPVRIRIQNGANDNVDEWIILPSTLHLEILQLLQTVNSEASMSQSYQSPEKEAEYEGEISAFDLIEALNSSYDDDEAEKISAATFNQALKYLYDHQLVYFENDLTENNDDSDVIAKHFQGVNVIDFRES